MKIFSAVFIFLGKLYVVVMFFLLALCLLPFAALELLFGRRGE